MSKTIIRDYTRFFSKIGQARRPDSIRTISEIYLRNKESMITFASGMPNPKLFPFKTVDINLTNGNNLKLNETLVESALQYNASPGIPAFVDQLKDFVFQYHRPITPNIDLCVTNGSSDGLFKAFDLLVSQMDTVIVDGPTFPASLESLRPIGCNLIAIPSDSKGMRIDILRKTLSKWSPIEASNPNSDIPKIIYVIPNCSNPTGVSMSIERRENLYELAREYNLLILEDDPYYFLQVSKKRLPSLLSMDVDGRVLRFDSFSKIISAGLRVGFVTGPLPLITQIVNNQMVSNIHVSSFSQILVSSLMEQWGHIGFEQHVKNVCATYEIQKDNAIKAAEKHLTGLVEWNAPSGGMFLWMKILGVHDTKKMIEERAQGKKILLVPGCYFYPDSLEPSKYVRLSYSTATPEQLDEGFRRFRELILEELHLGE